MSANDHGGFDVLLEVSSAAAMGLLRSGITFPERTAPVADPIGLAGTATVRASPTSVRFAPAGFVDVELSLAGSSFVLSSWPIPVALPTDTTITVNATVVVRDTVDASGLSATIDSAPNTMRGTPAITVTLDKPAILASAPVTILLGWIYLNVGEAAVATTRQTLFDRLQSTLETSLRDELAATPLQRTLFALPSQLVPPPPAPGIAVPPTVSPVALDTSASTLRVGVTLGGTPGDPTRITRSPLRTSSVTGTPIDAIALVISNGCLLRDIGRSVVGSALGLTPAGFNPSDPFLWLGSTTTTIAGAAATISFAHLFVNASQQLVLVFNFASSALAGGITVSGTVTVVLDLTVGADATGITVTAAPRTPVLSGARADIAWWVYLLTAATLGYGGIVAMTLADTIIDGSLTAAAVGLPTSTVTIPLPAGLPAVVVTGQSLMQGDAPQRVAVATPFSLIGPLPPLLPAGRDHDLIVTFALR